MCFKPLNKNMYLYSLCSAICCEVFPNQTFKQVLCLVIALSCIIMLLKFQLNYPLLLLYITDWVLTFLWLTVWEFGLQFHPVCQNLKQSLLHMNPRYGLESTSLHSASQNNEFLDKSIPLIVLFWLHPQLLVKVCKQFLFDVYIVSVWD